jgi:hypothetical protein
MELVKLFYNPLRVHTFLGCESEQSRLQNWIGGFMMKMDGCFKENLVAVKRTGFILSNNCI